MSILVVAILGLLAMYLVGHGHPVDSRLDAREYPFGPPSAIQGLRVRGLPLEAAPAAHSERRRKLAAQA